MVEAKPRAPQPEPAPVAAAPVWERDPSGDPWAQVLSAASGNRRMRILLNDCSLVNVADDQVVIAVSDALLSAAQSNEKELGDLLARAWDRAVKVELRGASQVAPAGAASEPAPEPTTPITEHPLVKQAMELFSAKLVGVQARKPQA